MPLSMEHMQADEADDLDTVKWHLQEVEVTCGLRSWRFLDKTVRQWGVFTMTPASPSSGTVTPGPISSSGLTPEASSHHVPPSPPISSPSTLSNPSFTTPYTVRAR